MPNHCQNNLTVTGDSEQLQRFIQAITKEPDKDGNISIKQLVPMPEALEGTQSPTPESPEPNPHWAVSLAEGKITQEWHDELCEKQRTRYEAGVKAKAETGYSNWLDWTHDNWGTKWGDYDDYVEIHGDGSVEIGYMTAWGPFDEKFWHKVSAMFPGLEFLIVYDEPGMCFAGSEKFVNGKTVYSEYINDTTQIISMPEDPNDEDWQDYFDAKSNLMDQLFERAEVA